MGGAGAIATAGPCLAVITPDAHGVRLFDAITGGRIDELRLPGHFIVGLYATPDGQRLITVEDVFLAHWGDFRPGWGLGMGPGPAGPTPNPNTAPAQGQGRTAAATERYRVNLWDIARIDKAARPLATLMTVENETNGWTLPPLVAVSPDSHTIATASRFKTAVTLWSAATGAALPGGPIETSVELTALALGPGDQLAAAGNGEIRLWEVDSRLPMPSLPTTQGFVRMLRFSPRRPLLAVLGGTGREVELWDTADTAVHSLIAVLPTSEMVSDLAFAPDGRTIAAVGRSPMTSIWTVVEGEIRTRLGGFDALTRTMAFRSDGLLALGSLKGTIRFWNAGQLVSSSPAADVTPEEDPAKAITTAMERPATGTTDDAANRDRPVVLTFDDHGRLVTLERDALRICPAPPQCTDGQLIRFPSGSDRNGPMFFVPLAASSDGQTLMINHGQQLYLWHSSAPEKLVRLQPPTDLLTARERDRENDRPRNKRERGGGLGGGGGGPGGGGGRNRPGFGAMPFLFGPMAVTPRGDRVYVVEGPGSVLAWAVDGEKATSLSWSGQIADATSLALSPDGTRLAIGGRSGIVTVVGTTSGEVRARLQPESEGAPGWVGSMAFAPSGRELAVGNQQGQVELWSLSSASTPLLRLPGHRGSVAALAFDTQGNHLAAAGSDKTVDVWNLERLRDELSRLGLGW